MSLEARTYQQQDFRKTMAQVNGSYKYEEHDLYDFNMKLGNMFPGKAKIREIFHVLFSQKAIK